MFLITHVATPVSIAAGVDLIRLRQNKKPLLSPHEYLILGFCALLPDMFWPDSTGPYNLGLTVTHSLWFSLAALCGILFLAWLFYRPLPFALKACLFWLASLTHLLWDIISGGKEIFYPFSHEVVGRRYVPMKLWYLIDLAILVFAVLILLRIRERNRAG